MSRQVNPVSPIKIAVIMALAVSLMALIAFITDLALGADRFTSGVNLALTLLFPLFYVTIVLVFVTVSCWVSRQVTAWFNSREIDQENIKHVVK